MTPPEDRAVLFEKDEEVIVKLEVYSIVITAPFKA